MTIFTLGPKGTYANQAAITYFQDQPVEFLGTISDIFEQVEKNSESFGVVPLENMIEGSVRETLDLLYETDLKVYDILELNVNHVLASKSRGFDTIISHPQAIAQCRKFLKKRHRDKKLQTISSTAGAAKRAGMSDKYAAISSAFAAQTYGLRILSNDISDYKNNKTKFAIISQKMDSKPYTKTLIAVTPTTDEPGLLIKILYPFHENDINLTKIESRPEKSTLDKYIFFIDFQADYRQAKARKIFTYLQKDIEICDIKVLGGQI